LGQTKAASLPINRGFNTDFGYLGGAEDHYTNENGGCGSCGKHVDLWRDHGPATGENGTGYSAHVWNDEAVRLIKGHAGDAKPWFMYLALQCAHAPNEPDYFANLYSNTSHTQDYIDYNGMISAVDSTVGNVTSVLKGTRQWNNTLLVFTSDNGGPAGASVSGESANNYPLRGGKHTAWEGGHRVLAFVTGGLLPPAMRGKKLEGYVHCADWYVTFARLAGVDPTDDQPGFPSVDGIDQWPYLTGQVAKSARTELPLASRSANHEDVNGTDPQGGSAALIVGDYKLVRFAQQYAIWMGPNYPNASTGGPGRPYEPVFDCGSAGCMFNIIEDPGEHLDIAKDPKYAATLAKLQARARALDLTAIEAIKPTGWRHQNDQSLACEVMQKNGGIWGPTQPK
jgi:arylsulfatase A-like enzyme